MQNSSAGHGFSICASLRAARIVAQIQSTRFRPSLTARAYHTIFAFSSPLWYNPGMGRLLDFSPYLLAASTIVFAAVGIVKDWGDYKHKWMKTSALAAMCVFGVLTFVSVYQDRAAERHLEGEVEAANKAQTDNTALYVKSFGELSRQVSDLKTQVKTQELQQKLASVQADLEKTQKALAPGPKTHLTFSFDPPSTSSDGKHAAPTTEVSLPVDTNGIVHVPFDILNTTDVDALDGDVNLVICNACSFAREPDGFTHLTNQPKTERYMAFARVLADTQVGKTVDIGVPQNVPNVQIGITVRCRTCTVTRAVSIGTINLKRDFERRY